MSETFEFTVENRQEIDRILSRYPVKRAAMLPTLHLAQQQHGHITSVIEEHVARLLEVPVVDVREVISFYSLFTQKPLGNHHIRLCMSISCWVRGCDQIRDYLQEKLGVAPEHTTSDGNISWEAVPDCLGACELAPMLQLDGYFEGPLQESDVDQILSRCRSDSAANGSKADAGSGE